VITALEVDMAEAVTLEIVGELVSDVKVELPSFPSLPALSTALILNVWVPSESALFNV
jgi:hypothetical protein